MRSLCIHACAARPPQARGRTALHYAACHDSCAWLLELLVRAGGRPEFAVDDDGLSPLLLAEEHDAYDCEALLENADAMRPWTAATHSAFPPPYRRAVAALLLACRRKGMDGQWLLRRALVFVPHCDWFARGNAERLRVWDLPPAGEAGGDDGAWSAKDGLFTGGFWNEAAAGAPNPASGVGSDLDLAWAPFSDDADA